MTVLGTKHDAEKSRYDLVPWGAMESVVRVLTYGARKYEPDNWKHIDSPRARYIAAGLRHLAARARGELIDQESGEPHAAHAVCSLLFLIWHDHHSEIM